MVLLIGLQKSTPPEELEREEDDVKVKICNLTKKFHDLVINLRKQCSNVDNVSDTLMTLPQPVHLTYSQILDKMIDSLEEVQCGGNVGVMRTFFKLNECWNFLDFEVLQCMIEEHGSEQLKIEMNSYLNNLCQFRKETTVHQLIRSESLLYKPEVVPERYKFYVQKLNLDPKTCTIQMLEDFRRDTRYSIQGAPLSVAALILDEIFRSSVIVVWKVEEREVNRLSESIKELIATNYLGFIERYSIEFLLLDDYMLYPCNCIQQVKRVKQVACFHRQCFIIIVAILECLQRRKL